MAEADELAGVILSTARAIAVENAAFFLAQIVSESAGLVHVKRLDAATADGQGYPKLIANRPGVAATVGGVALMGAVDPTKPVMLGEVSITGTATAAGFPTAFTGRQNVDTSHGAVFHYRLPAAASRLELYLYGMLPAPYRQRSVTPTVGFAGSHTHTYTRPSYIADSDRITPETSDRNGGAGVVTLYPQAAESEAWPTGVRLYVDGTDRTTALSGPWTGTSDWAAGPLDILSWGGASGAHTLSLTTTGSGLLEWVLYAYP